MVIEKFLDFKLTLSRTLGNMKRLVDRRKLILSTVAAAAASATLTKLTAAETPLACNLKALSVEERRAHRERSERLLASAKVTPIESGYALNCPSSQWLESA